MLVNLLFVDDSYSDHTKISSLTGVLIPVHKYNALRTQYYQILEWIIKPNENTFNLNPPELHASKLFKGMPGIDDKQKLKTFNDIVDFVNSNGIEVYRSGVYVTDEVTKNFTPDPEMYSFNFDNLIRLLKDKLSNEMIIPVMDKLPETNKKFTYKDKDYDYSLGSMISGSRMATDILRETGGAKLLTIKNTENVLGEVFYADSKYAIFIQIADMIAYLLHILDFSQINEINTDFKSKLLEIALKINQKLINSTIIALESINTS